MQRDDKLRPLLFLILAGTIVSHALIFWINRQSIAKGSGDFVAFYSAAQIIKSGHGDSLYDSATQRQFQQQFPSFRNRPLLFNHPPFEVLFYLPLAFFSFPTAFVLWTVVNFGALCAVLILLFPYLRNFRESLSSSLVVMLVFSFFPVLIAPMQGQNSILFLLLYGLVFVHLRRGKEGRAGLFAALGMFRFQLMIPLLLALAFRKRWKVLAAFLLGSAGLALLSILITGWRGPIAYVGLLWEMNQAARSARGAKDIYSIHPEKMPNLRGFFDVHLGGRIPEAYILLFVLALSLLFVLWSLSKGIGKRFGVQSDLVLPFALHTTVTLLVSYHMHLYDVSLLLLPLLLVANHLARVPDARSPVRLGLVLLVVALFLSPTYVVPFYYGWLNLLTLPLVLFALLISAEISREKRPVRASS